MVSQGRISHADKEVITGRGKRHYGYPGANLSKEGFNGKAQMKREISRRYQLSIFESVAKVCPAVKNSDQITSPEENFHADLEHGMAWCPYCGFYMLFAWDSRLQEPRCPGCSISIHDFYTSKFNKLVTTENFNDFAASVRKAGLKHLKPLFFEKDGK